MRLDSRALRALGAVLVAVVAALVWWLQADTGGDEEPARSDSAAEIDSESGLPWVAVDDLPRQARETLELIEAGGPFPYERDGVTFGNYERLLPARERGHYREYTVPTPGVAHRGARRIVVGAPDELYWTADHYASFQRIDATGGRS